MDTNFFTGGNTYGGNQYAKQLLAINSPVPFDAIRDENGQPILDENGNYIRADQ